ncbi:MAG: S24 family peptidase [Cyanobacteriota bacterium]|nr:S24 family peptidase [Cyanobacteriota bacterium]
MVLPAPPSSGTATSLTTQLIRCRASTVVLRVSGESMQGAGITHGDLLIVDRGLEPRPGQIVVAWLDGGFTLKRLVCHRGRLRLEAAHPAYPPLELDPGADPRLWGVALHVIRHLEPAPPLLRTR